MYIVEKKEDEKLTIKNMFPIELKSIHGILEEANIDNLEDFHALMSEVINLPNDIEDEINAKEALDFIEKIKKIENIFRNSRLEDGKVFKEGLKSVEKFYKDYESSLKEKKILLQERISVFANRAAAVEDLRKAREVKADANNPSIPSAANHPFNSSGTESKPQESQEPEITSDLKFYREWTISKIDINKLNLEALRNFFSEYHLKMAINKHLKNNGPILEGVEYQNKIKI